MGPTGPIPWGDDRTTIERETMFQFRKTVLFSALVAIMLVALAAPVAAASPFVENYQDKGRAGIAGNGDCTFGPGGDESCHFINLFAQTGWIKEGQVRHKGETVCVTRGKYELDGATGDFTDTIEQGCGPANVSVARDLSSASASGTIATDICVVTQATDDECVPAGTGSIGLNLDWTAVEPAYSNRGSWTETFGECVLKDQFRGTYRPADVSGKVGGMEVFGDIAKGQAKFSVRCH
jgi:hypothetical protein